MSKALATSRGSGVVASDNVPTVSYLFAATEGNEVTKGSTRVEWLSPPVAADVTISGSITGNVWASESNMSANVAVLLSVEIIRANALASSDSNTRVYIDNRIGNAAEVDVTTRAVRNGTLDTTNVTANRGDRIRVLIVSKGAGSQVSGYTWNASWNGTSAAADGDSYVTFAETITFESAPGSTSFPFTSGAATVASSSSAEMTGLSFTAPGDLSSVSLWPLKSGSPTDNFVVEVRTDSAGSPSSTVVGTIATVAGASLTTTATQTTWGSLGISLSPGTTYWLVMRRDGTLSGTDYFRVGLGATVRSSKVLQSGSWIDNPFFQPALAMSFAVSVVYLTDTASAVSTASVDKEAWTSRGSGVVNKLTNTTSGWVAPLQLTDGSGGTVIDWFTKQLSAFTLTGMAVANLRALETSATGRCSVRCEIARVESDGTSPTVWASWCIAPTGTNNGELTTSEVARTANVSGDDLAITDGQRLRIRIYWEDTSNAAMVGSFGTRLYYSGTSAAASGDTYITFPQTLTEYASGPFTYTKAGYGKESG